MVVAANTRKTVETLRRADEHGDIRRRLMADRGRSLKEIRPLEFEEGRLPEKSQVMETLSERIKWNMVERYVESRFGEALEGAEGRERATRIDKIGRLGATGLSNVLAEKINNLDGVDRRTVEERIEKASQEIKMVKEVADSIAKSTVNNVWTVYGSLDEGGSGVGSILLKAFGVGTRPSQKLEEVFNGTAGIQGEKDEQTPPNHRPPTPSEKVLLVLYNAAMNTDDPKKLKETVDQLHRHVKEYEKTGKADLLDAKMQAMMTGSRRGSLHQYYHLDRNNTVSRG